MVKFEAYSNYASIMASQGVTPATFEKWNNPEESKPIDTSANTDDIITAFEARMNEVAKRNRNKEQ